MTAIAKNINNFIAVNKEELIFHRRWFHQHPETSFKEFKTSEYIQNFLNSIGIREIETAAKTGVICKIGSGNYVTAGRFNMDGLPIPEKNNLSFCSLYDGYSHSCGHDFELAWGLMIAKYFQEHKPTNGAVKLFFQPAEEGSGEELHGKTGGQIFAELGLFNVNSIMSLHVEPEVELNTISIASGEVTCSAYDFEFILHGKTCHAAKPQQGINPVFYASKLISEIYNLQEKITTSIKDEEGFVLITVSIMSTRMEYEKINQEETLNTIPEYAIVKGISRVRSEFVKDELVKGLKNLTKKFPELAECKLNLNRVAVATTNNKNIVENVLETAQENNLTIISKRTTWRDDAGWASEKAPTAHGFVGINDGMLTILHSPTFNPNEDALSTGLKIFLGTMERNLNKITI